MDPKERIKKLTNDIEDGANGGTEKEERHSDDHEASLELSSGIGGGSDHGAFWWHL